MAQGFDLAAYGLAFAAVTAELAYGAWLLNNPAPQLKARGYSIIYEALESVVTGLILASALTVTPHLVSALGLKVVSIDATVNVYAKVRDRYVAYVIDLANVARDLALTGFLSPLAVTWNAASGLANFFASYLVSASTALLVASRFCAIFGAPIASLGIVLAGIRKFRKLGPSLAIGVAVLRIYVGAAAAYLEEMTDSIKFKYTGLPLAGIAQYFAGAVGEVVSDSKIMGECSAWLTLSAAIAAAVGAGLAVAAGGLPSSLISRLRV